MLALTGPFSVDWNEKWQIYLSKWQKEQHNKEETVYMRCLEIDDNLFGLLWDTQTRILGPFI